MPAVIRMSPLAVASFASAAMVRLPVWAAISSEPLVAVVTSTPAFNVMVSAASKVMCPDPLVMSAVVGVLWSAFRLPLPKPLTNLCEILGASSSPCALFAMGLSLVGQIGGGDTKETGWLVFLKLVVQPAITAWLAFAVFGLDPFWAMSAVILAALPTGALTFVVAQRYGLYVPQTTQATLASTVLSVVTVSALLAWFRIG